MVQIKLFRQTSLERRDGEETAHSLSTLAPIAQRLVSFLYRLANGYLIYCLPEQSLSPICNFLASNPYRCLVAQQYVLEKDADPCPIGRRESRSIAHTRLSLDLHSDDKTCDSRFCIAFSCLSILNTLESYLRVHVLSFFLSLLPKNALFASSRSYYFAQNLDFWRQCLSLFRKSNGIAKANNLFRFQRSRLPSIDRRHYPLYLGFFYFQWELFLFSSGNYTISKGRSQKQCLVM